MAIKTSIIVTVFILVFYATGYPQGHSATLNSITKDLDNKIATGNFNPRTDIDVISYKTSETIPGSRYTKIQKDFIYTSGFPVVNSPQSNSDGNVLPKTFEEADVRYKKFKEKESGSPFIEVFEQDAASLIIRRYLLDKPEKNKELQYYTEELLKSHSPNYGLLYLAIKQLQQFAGEKKVSEYKRIIHTDTTNLKYDKRIDTLQTELKINSVKANVSATDHAMQQMVLKGIYLRQKRDSFYIRKIDSL